MRTKASHRPRWLLYFLSTFVVGLIPAVWHWFADGINTQTHVFQYFWSLPEGYIFAFLVSSSTVIEAGFNDEFIDNKLVNGLRVFVGVISLLLAGATLSCYTSMLRDDSQILQTMQFACVLVAGAANFAYMSLKISRDAE